MGDNLLTYALNFGATYAGLSDLRAQLRDLTGSDVGSPITAGFIEIGSGSYQWTYDNTAQFRGTVSFYSNGNPTNNLITLSINPQEDENADIPTSDIEAGGCTGSGAYAVTLTVNDGTNPLPSSIVSFSQGMAYYYGVTDNAGVIAFSLNAGTYTLSITHAGYNYAPTTQVISGVTSITATMVEQSVPSPTLCGAYACDTDIWNVFGQNNIAQWSNMDGGYTQNDARVQAALNWADATIQSLFREYGNYIYPLAPTNEGIIIVQYWDAVLAGTWLYESRGLRDEDDLGNHLASLKKRVLAEINDYRSHNLLSAAYRWPQANCPTTRPWRG